MRRTNIILSESLTWRSVAAATACLVLLGMFAAAGHAHDQHEFSGADCVGCRLLQAQSFDEPGVDAPVLLLSQTSVEAEAVDIFVVDERYRLAPLRGPPSLA